MNECGPSGDDSSLIEDWPCYPNYESHWQRQQKSVRDRSEKCFERGEMSDIGILSVDENWWFGATVKDFYGHKFLLGSASPVLHHILYEMEFCESNKDIILNLNSKLNVTLTRTKTYDSERLELNGIPPIATEALLEYIYKDKFCKSDFENGYSRNLLWRLWHASVALEMDHLAQITSDTIDETMCEETVFWDLNYSMTFNEMSPEYIKDKVMKMIENLGARLFEHPNFVWIERTGIEEILNRRKPGSCEPLIILNNLLRWVLYQLDRLACCEIHNKSGSEIPIQIRLEWIKDCRDEKYSHIDIDDLEMNLRKGTEFMPWTELSQVDYLKYVSGSKLISEEKLLQTSLELMGIVVQNPDRLKYSEYNFRNKSLTMDFNQTDPKEDTRKDLPFNKSNREICIHGMMDGSKKDLNSLISI
ncbi:uncharacterized protein [Lepeophtheirus salmonis]|uniref:uncharacterized protein n=1 Tax=Lepeophtheirus salmonis TaxID=72036 RepID=UPI001AE1DF81|nr:uncharacterized protein LOC121115152 isoform X1 [Lepeophtheirus salmonis]